MAFVMIKKGPTGVPFTDEAPYMKMSVTLADGSQHRGVQIYGSRTIWESAGIKYSGKDGQRTNIAVHEGIGEDVGYWLLTEHESRHEGYKLTGGDHEQAVLRLAMALVKLKHYVPNEIPAPLTEVEYVVDAAAHTILIQVPEWMRFNPLSVPMVPKVEPPPPKTPDTKLNREQRRRVAKIVARHI